MWLSPLEQFKVVIVRPLGFLGYDLSISNSTIYLLLACSSCARPGSMPGCLMPTFTSYFLINLKDGWGLANKGGNGSDRPFSIRFGKLSLFDVSLPPE